MRKLTITFGDNEHGSYVFDVFDEYGHHCDGLTFGEAIEQITELAHPRIPPEQRRARYPMYTPTGWQELRQRSDERRAANSAEAEAARTADAEARFTRESALSAALKRLYDVTSAMDAEHDGPRPSEAEVAEAMQDAQQLLTDDVPF